MLVGTCLAVLGVAATCLARAQPPHYNIDDKVDQLLPQINEIILGKGLDSVRVADYGDGARPALAGVRLANVSTLMRSGEAEMWQEDERTLALSLNLGLREARVIIDLAAFLGSGCWWEVGDASLEMHLAMHPTPTSPCVTTYRYFRITRLEDVIVHSSDPAWDGKPPPPEILDGIVPYYNIWINKPEVLQSVGEKFNLCDSA